MSNPIHPDDGIVISKKWIEGEITRLSNLRPDVISLPSKEYAQLHLLRHILHFHSQPLKPVLEVVYDEGFQLGMAYMSGPIDQDKFKTDFLNNPIEVK